MNIPGIYFNNYENFNEYSQLREKYLKFDKEIILRDDIINKLKNVVNSLKSENFLQNLPLSLKASIPPILE